MSEPTVRHELEKEIDRLNAECKRLSECLYDANATIVQLRMEKLPGRGIKINGRVVYGFKSENK